MSNVCEKLEEIEWSKIGDVSKLNIPKQPTLEEIWTELNRLKLENYFLKADKLELQKENNQLRNSIMILHNNEDKNSENDDVVMLNKYEEEYICGCETNKELKAMADAYAEFV